MIIVFLQYHIRILLESLKLTRHRLLWVLYSNVDRNKPENVIFILYTILTAIAIL